MKVANLFLFGARVSDLLKISRVDRYGSLENWTPEAGNNSYQRILTKQKLLDIQEFIKIGKEKTSFPNTITAIFNQNPKFQNGKIELEIKPEALDIIDGQHRLFGFAKSDPKKINLEKTILAVTGIFFENATKKQIVKWNAQTFVEINQHQKKVPTDLIYLVKYSVMGERSPVALGTEALKILSTNSNSVLYKLIKIGQFSEKRKHRNSICYDCKQFKTII